MEPLILEYLCLPIYSTLRNRIRFYFDAERAKKERKVLSLEWQPSMSFFILDNYKEPRAYPNMELAQTISHLRRGTKDEDALQTADALMVLSLRSSLPAPSLLDSDTLQKLLSDFRGAEDRAVEILGNLLAKSAESLIINPPEQEKQDTQTKPAVFFKKVVGTIRRLQNIDYDAMASKKLHKSLFIIEAARILTEREGKEPTKTKVRELMESKGWGMGKTHDGARKWRQAWEKSGLNTLPE